MNFICKKKFSLNNLFRLFVFIILLQTSFFAQDRDKVTASTQIVTDKISKTCKELDLGKMTFLPVPKYPGEAQTAKIGGSVQLEILINEKGDVAEIVNSKGDELLLRASTETARKAKFTPTICDGVLINVPGVIIYNFIPFVVTETYFTPEKIEDFLDVQADSNFYESILNLTENYNLTFGYGDKKFHSNSPLTKGDFIHFLRLTLDFLQKRSEMSNKIPLEIGLYSPYNPQSIKSAEEIKDLKEKYPYSESTKFLVSKYNISLIDKEKNLNGNLPLTQNEVIDYWTKIFGEEAVPVNFKKTENGSRIFTRGEFSLFLQESLYVLSYKVLP